jgi:hypothetical protein
MAKKKSVKKKVVAKRSKRSKKTVSSKSVEIKMQPIFVENFVALQRVMVNLSTKFENLNQQLSKLLNLFEMSAKTLAKKDFKFGQGEDNEKVVKKLTELTDQNKILAKGLTMIHEDEQEQKQMIAPPAIPSELNPPKQVPIPEIKPLPKPTTPTAKPQEEYQKSVPAKPQEPSK